MSDGALIGILGLVAVAACWVLSVVLYRVSASGTIARMLCVLLVLEGFVLLSAGFPGFVFTPSDPFNESLPALGLIGNLVHHLGDAAMVALYPTLLAMAIDTKLTRPFRDRRVRIVFAIVAVALALNLVFFPTRVGVTLFYSLVTLVFIYALVASIHAWRTAQVGIHRQRAGIFALAFGLRDLGWSMSYGIFAWLMWTQPELREMTPLGWLGKTVYALGTLLSVPLIAYAVLRGLLFDIDLRIRWTIKQSTVAGILIAVVFVVSEGASAFLSAELGNVAGLLAAAVVMFFLAPLQRFAEQVASAAMPNTQNTPEYAAHRKMQVYETAVADAHREGGISAKERALLELLRDSLGITPTDAEALERELLADQRS